MEDDESSSSDDERAIELSAIAAIFPELKTPHSSPFSASLELPVIPITPLQVLFEQLVTESTPPTVLPTPPDSTEAGVQKDGAENEPEERPRPNTESDIHSLSYLPPLLLQIDLPEGYPSEKPPGFQISTNPPWLSGTHTKRLVEHGKTLWEELGRNPVVFDFVDYLQQSAETLFDIPNLEKENMKFSRDLKISLLDFDSRAKREAFERSTFECGVCLDVKKGSACHRLLLCSHVFCVACLQDFLNSCITEGDVDNVKCLAPGCGKETSTVPQGEIPEEQPPRRPKKKQDRTLNPSELLQIPLEQDIVQRYVMLKRKKKLESDRSQAYCPRNWCQGAARSTKHPKSADRIGDDGDVSDTGEEDNAPKFTYDPTSETGELPPIADRLAVCEDCSYAFCVVCKKGWHGELAHCFPRKQAELNAEEEATAKYIALHTATCPTCSAPCQKTMGCNHMICFKCRTHFCYLCSSWLTESNPYAHFNDIKSSCYMRLWELEGGDGGEGEVGLGFGGGPMGEEHDHEAFNPFGLVDEDDDSSDEELGLGDVDDNGRPLAFPLVIRQPPPPAPVPPRAPARAAQVQAPNPNAAAQGQGQGRAPQQPQNPAGRPRNEGLQRFLAMAQNDDEDEWDSDEGDDSDFEGFDE